MTASSNNSQVIFIGIAGPSGSGKTTYAKHSINRLRSPLNLIGLDDFFLCGIPIKHPILGHIQNEEEPETLNTEKLLNLLRQIKYEPKKRTPYHRNDISLETNVPIFVIVEGFLLFALSNELTDMFNIRIFFQSTQSQCCIKRYRRSRRIPEITPDEQVVIPNDFQQWFDHLVWASYLKRRNLQMSKSEKTFDFREYNHKNFTAIDIYIDKRIKELLERR